jgi:hypothetical protein
MVGAAEKYIEGRARGAVGARDQTFLHVIVARV